MLRAILQTPRKTVEDTASSSTDSAEEEDEEEEVPESWVEWVPRATRIAELAAAKYKVPDWAAVHLIRKWRLAGHTARRSDDRWSTLVLDFVPLSGLRRVGHPQKRWSEDIVKFFEQMHGPGTDWKEIAQFRSVWQELEQEFVTWYLKC